MLRSWSALCEGSEQTPPRASSAQEESDGETTEGQRERETDRDRGTCRFRPGTIIGCLKSPQSLHPKLVRRETERDGSALVLTTRPCAGRRKGDDGGREEEEEEERKGKGGRGENALCCAVGWWRPCSVVATCEP